MLFVVLDMEERTDIGADMDELAVAERIEPDAVRIELAGTEVCRFIAGEDVGGLVENRDDNRGVRLFFLGSFGCGFPRGILGHALFDEDPRLGVPVMVSGPPFLNGPFLRSELIRSRIDMVRLDRFDLADGRIGGPVHEVDHDGDLVFVAFTRIMMRSKRQADQRTFVDRLRAVDDALEFAAAAVTREDVPLDHGMGARREVLREQAQKTLYTYTHKRKKV